MTEHYTVAAFLEGKIVGFEDIRAGSGAKMYTFKKLSNEEKIVGDKSI